jgi:hypothetical protein
LAIHPGWPQDLLARREHDARPARFPEHPVNREAAPVAAAGALAADLRLIRQRLTSGAIRDPRVSAELHELFQRAVALTEIGERRGRHRAEAAIARSAPAPSRPSVLPRGTAARRDAPALPAKPDPLSARTPAALVASLREYRDWTGRPSLRTMAAQAGQPVGASTIGAALNRDSLPTYKVTVAIIEGCGGGPRDREAYAAAWHRLASGPRATRPGGRRPALRVVPAAASAGG